MGKQAPWKTGTATPAATPSNPGEAPPAPTLTAEQKRALFVAWDQANEAVEAAEEALKEARSKIGATVQAIVTNLGKGPFNWKGRIITPIVRKERNGDNDVYIMRAPKAREVTKIV